MISIYGIILLEKTEIVLRIYEVNRSSWKLIRYENIKTTPDEIITRLAKYFTTKDAQFVTQWKVGGRGLTQANLNLISSSLGLEIDSLRVIREQELLCKGLFTELW